MNAQSAEVAQKKRVSIVVQLVLKHLGYDNTIKWETFKEENLLDLMQNDEFYYGYMAKAALSSSSIKTLLSSPKTYKYVLDYGSGESQALRDGWLFHTCILEPHVFEEQIFVDVQSKNTKAYKEALAQHGKVFTAKENEMPKELLMPF